MLIYLIGIVTSVSSYLSNIFFVIEIFFSLSKRLLNSEVAIFFNKPYFLIRILNPFVISTSIVSFFIDFKLAYPNPYALSNPD